jgi:excisionase family DNA binding protein
MKIELQQISIAKLLKLKSTYNMAQEFLTTEELAEELKTHPQYIRDQARMGLIPAYKVGNHWRFILSEVKKQLQVNATRATEKAFTTQIR